MNKTTNSDWHAIRKQLLERMDGRPLQMQGFNSSDRFFFIARCGQICKDADSDAARAALDWIMNNGCFRLAGDTVKDLLDLLGIDDGATASGTEMSGWETAPLAPAGDDRRSTERQAEDQGAADDVQDDRGRTRLRFDDPQPEEGRRGASHRRREHRETRDSIR